MTKLYYFAPGVSYAISTPFPDLFEWVVDDLGDLPLPRKSYKSHYPNPYLVGFSRLNVDTRRAYE